MTAARRLDGVNEARPGNYAFYDYTQSVLGSCAVGDCAITVLAGVVSSQPGATHCVIDAGALALSKDTGPEHGPHATIGELFADAADLAGDLTVGVGLFIDEIHRWNRAQQDAFLPHVESGLITLIGATTENPSFEVISPLLSRARVIVLNPLSDDAIRTIVNRAMTDAEHGLGAS